MSDVVIAAAGLVCPIGLSVPEAAAAARARVARLRAIDWLDRRLQPFIVGRVPDEGLPDLPPELAAQALTYREARMIRLAQAALEQVLGPWHAAGGGRLPLLLALPEHHTTHPLVPDLFLDRLGVACPQALDVPHSLAAPRGRAAGLMALREASARVARGDAEAILVGGVDCLVDLYLLGMLEQQDRVRNDVNSDGFTPSEGAAFVLLTTAERATRMGWRALGQLRGVGLGQEAGHLYASEPYLGEGLAQAFASLLQAAPVSQPIQTVYASFNGERYWAREFGVARLRQSAAFVPDHAMEHPAECFGDLGAAHGLAMLALAAHGLSAGYRGAPCLVYASSDRGERAAALLDHHL